ncbi:MAG: patatin-like phospholipase family protein [Flavobacteriales bacterium]|nr:patatin-like phospholipase family protein [Flavobacteriales bacterium]
MIQKFVLSCWIAACCFISAAQSPDQSQIRNLVFEGAGIRGVAYVGVLSELEQNGIASHINQVAGTSAGAITALLFSLGYSSSEMEGILSETKLSQFNDGEGVFIGGIYRMKHRYGWYKPNEVEKWLERLIEYQTGCAEMTLSEHHDAGYPDVYFTATNLSAQSMEVLSWRTYPNMKLSSAVRISMSIPLYFGAAFVDQDGGVYNTQNPQGTREIMVDGGILGNYPIHVFDSVITSFGVTRRVPNPQTLGIRMETARQHHHNQQSHNLVPQSIVSFESYIGAFYTLVIENLNRKDLTDSDWHRTISVSCVGVKPRIRRMSCEEQERLIGSGRSACQNYLSSSS